MIEYNFYLNGNENCTFFATALIYWTKKDQLSFVICVMEDVVNCV